MIFFVVHAARSRQMNYAYGVDHHLSMLEEKPENRVIEACRTSQTKLAYIVFNPCKDEYGRILSDRIGFEIPDVHSSGH